MGRDMYLKLGERLNQFAGKIALVDSYLEILAEMYTEEEALFAINFPEGPCTLHDLAAIYKKGEHELLQFLETMATKGTMFIYDSQEGKKFELMPFFPGAIEYHMYNVSDDPARIKKATELFVRLKEESVAYKNKLLAENPGMVLPPPVPHFRIVSVNESLPAEKEVHSYEDILRMIDKETSIAAMKCICRFKLGPNHNGRPCLIPDIPEHSCLTFGKVAEYILEHKFGDAIRLTREECKKVLETCNKAGLVQNANNFVDGLQFVCNCCKCCCGMMRDIRSFGPGVMVNTSNFAPVINGENCNGCGICVDRCPVCSIVMKDGLAVIKSDICIGCGNCATVCPTKCITMTRVTDKMPLLGNRNVGQGASEFIKIREAD